MWTLYAILPAKVVLFIYRHPSSPSTDSSPSGMVEFSSIKTIFVGIEQRK